MKTPSEINQLILEFEIRKEMESSFKSILENHTSEDLILRTKTYQSHLKKLSML